MRRWRSTNLPRTPGLYPQVVFSSSSSSMLHHSITSLSLYSCSFPVRKAFFRPHTFRHVLSLRTVTLFTSYSLSTLPRISQRPSEPSDPAPLSFCCSLPFLWVHIPVAVEFSLSLSSFVLYSIGFLVNIRSRATLLGKAFGACIGGLLGFTSCDTTPVKENDRPFPPCFRICQSQSLSLSLSLSLSKTETSPVLKRNYRILFCRSFCPTWAGPVASKVRFAKFNLQTTPRQLSVNYQYTSTATFYSASDCSSSHPSSNKNPSSLGTAVWFLIASLTSSACYRRRAAPPLS
ncbi:hypothetical protein F5B19DRAFT_395936 [Rostrohypoxylon terebratum]|nr:hypothetical protein F5B19DRAFT_395936 [Rostrohypoxylon terebratum]